MNLFHLRNKLVYKTSTPAEGVDEAKDPREYDYEGDMA